ncbi:MAG: hypothetical protein KGJ64_14275, partial [Betaproteobacteria bacterium]|nr:hypothetical protein [Betaproteobacteria bacterium]
SLPGDAGVLAVASDAEPPANAAPGGARLDLARPAAVADWLIAHRERFAWQPPGPGPESAASR